MLCGICSRSRIYGNCEYSYVLITVHAIDTRTSFVETKGRTLEEINEIFEAKDPVKSSLQQHVVEETDLGLLYHGLMNELNDMEGVVSPVIADSHAVPPGFDGPPAPRPHFPSPYPMVSASSEAVPTSSNSASLSPRRGPYE